MERKGAAMAQAVCRGLGALSTATLLLVAVGCRVVELRSPWERYYDADKYGTAEENIRDHFNMHRGRWWNYYTRGACYLKHGHYEKARCDFAEAIRIRPDEKRNAHAYGMHFMDYFPHRETGIAFYFEGKRKASEGISETMVRETKEKLLGQAKVKLTASLSQDESSRAKHYLNQTNKALWQMSGNDRIPPVIHVKGPIYTNKRVFRLGLAVTDSQSGVEEIQISAPDGDVEINRPKLLVELAQEEVAETVELTIGSQQKEAVVDIKASDLAGNESDWYRVHITVDTHAPTAAVTILGNAGWRGHFAAFVWATDDSGLREIRAGEDQNGRLSCYGERQYRGTVFGKPVRGELNIRVVDIAGNAVVASIPVGESSDQARISQAPWRQTLWMFPRTGRIATYDWNRCFSPAYLAGLSVYQPNRSAALYWSENLQTASLASSGVWSISESNGPKKPQFHFPDHVRRPDGKAKETSQDFFFVEGALRNAQGIKRITVDGIDVHIDPGILREIAMGTGDDLLFHHTLDLAQYPEDDVRSIEVEALREDGSRCAGATLRATKRNNCIRDPDAVYRAVLLLRIVDTPYRRNFRDGEIPEGVYNAVLTSLREFRAPEPFGGVLVERLSVEDVSLVLGIKYAVAVRKSIDEVFGKAKSGHDLFIHGRMGLWGGDGEEELNITLRAMDLMTKSNLQFQSLGTEDADILAETRVPWKLLDRPMDPKGRNKYMDVLTSKVRENLPRVQAVARVVPAGMAEFDVSIDRGTNDGLFKAMSLRFYAYGDSARSENVYLTKIGDGRIAEVGKQYSRIRHKLDLRPFESGLIAITK